MEDNKSSGAKKKNTNLQRSKSESRAKSKTNEAAIPPFTNNRNLISNFGDFFKRNSPSKKENKTAGGPDPSTIDSPDSSKYASPLITPTTESRGILSAELDADEYFMEHKKRGKAIILNHKKFKREETRNGTQHDVDRLLVVLNNLKFEVEVHNDLNYIAIIQLLTKLSEDNYSDCDCIMFFVLTHGNKRQEISAYDVYYSVETIWEMFTADKCSTLAGKPKLFFINACRGRKTDAGTRLFRRTETDSRRKVQSYKIPNYADFLMAYSTAEGHLSYRGSDYGSCFIQFLCNVLEEHYKTKDLLKMLTITSRKVALEYTAELDSGEYGLHQIPSITSMLVRDIYFHE